MLRKLPILLFASVFIFACKKNESAVGVDVLPASDQIAGAYAEIYPTVSYSKIEDSLATSNVTNSNLLGSINDPVFGRFDASIYTNFEFSAGVGGVTLGAHATLDSAVLVLYYNSSTIIPFIGDTNNPLRLDVFPLTQKMYHDSVYYSKRQIGYDANYNMIEGGQSVTFEPRPYTTFLINKDDQTPSPYPQMRIRLRKEFGEKMFNTAYLSSLSAFQNAFYGFYITTQNSILPQPSYGSVFYLNMLASAVELYYHNDAGIQTPIDIRCGASSVRYSHFDHDYQFLAEPSLSQQVSPPYDTSATGPGQQHIYLQGAGGLRAKLDFSELLNWRDSNIVINKAELILNIDRSKPDYYDSKLYPAPLKLFLEGIDATTGKAIPLVENSFAFGGGFDGTNYRFTFNIPHTVTQVITGKNSNHALYVSVYSPIVFPHRTVIGGCQSTAAPLRLRLWYTRLTFPKK